jgi:molecular chaperone DnaK
MNLGIDLGTTFSLAAYLNPQGVPTLVPDAAQLQWMRTPSVVGVQGERAWVGQALEALLVDEPQRAVVRGFKQHMGADVQPYTDDQGRAWPPEALSALVLAKLLRDVEAHCGEAVDHALITVPANFTDVQRKATLGAAALAGLRQVSLIEEPIAAAAHYGHSRRDAEQTLLVYDFGGGTFDATVLHIADGRLYVLATEGDNQLGGRLIDQRLVEQLQAEVRRRYGLDVTHDPAAQELLRRFAEAAKIALSQPGQGVMRKTVVLAGQVCELGLSPQQVAAAVQPAVDATLAACERGLEGAGLGWGQMDQVLLVGGSSLLPGVGRALAAASGKPAAALVPRQPHQAVAFGAAVLAGVSAGQGTTLEPVHQGVAPYHLGLRVRDTATGQPRVQVLVKRNSPLPARATTTVYTNRAEQTRVILEIVQSKGEHEQEQSLGYFAFGPIRAPRLNYPVELTLAYDADGLVRVTAKDMVTGEALQRELAAGGEADVERLQRGRACLAAVKLIS